MGSGDGGGRAGEGLQSEERWEADTSAGNYVSTVTERALQCIMGTQRRHT